MIYSSLIRNAIPVLREECGAHLPIKERMQLSLLDKDIPLAQMRI